MRSRSPSPLQIQQQQKKYYSREEVTQILRAMMEAKLTKIYQELQEKQQMIKVLNQKLNRNDNILQNSSKQIYEISQKNSQYSQNQMAYTVQIINKMLDQMLQNYWHTVQSQLNKIKAEAQDGIRMYHQTLQDKIGKMFAQIKNSCQENVETFKKKNNGYWAKVKEALNKMNSRVVQAEEKMLNIGLQISKYESERQQNSNVIKSLQNGKNTAKMLLQLKKSVTNVYKNFQQVMKLQHLVKEGYEKMGSIDKWNCDKCYSANPQSSASINSSRNRNDWKFQNNKSKFNQQDIVILQYSIEEDTLSNHQNYQKQQFPSRQNSKSEHLKPKSVQFRKQSNSSNQESFPLSPITTKIIQNSTYSNTDLLFGSQRNKTNQQIVNTNTSTKHETGQWYQNEYQNAPFNEIGRNEKSGSFHLMGNNIINSYGLNSNGVSQSRLLGINQNVASTSMLNFSLDYRKQMIESVRPRLVDMIETKGLHKPLKVFLDHINYLKNEQGNYLFDMKGNMFKISAGQFKQLEEEKIITNIAKKQQKQNKK